MFEAEEKGAGVFEVLVMWVSSPRIGDHSPILWDVGLTPEVFLRS